MIEHGLVHSVRTITLGNFLAVDAAAATNMVTNPGFEVDATGWQAYGSGYGGGSVARSTVRAQSGVASGLITWPTFATGSLIGVDVTGLVVGETYTASAYVYVPAGNPDVRLTQGFTSSGVYSAAKDQWVQVTHSFTATATNHPVGIEAEGTTAGQQCWVDVLTVTSPTVLQVADAIDFSEVGGTLRIAGTTYVYATRDETTNEINLASPFTVAAVADTPVDVWPLTVEKYAVVVVADNDEAVNVRIPHVLMDRMADGIRAATDRELVRFELRDGALVLLDVVGREPVVDGSYIDPTTLPANPSDGAPPASSPTPTILGSIRQIHLKWNPIVNPDQVTYDIHLSTSVGFAEGPATLVASTEGTAFVVQVENPDYTISYYLKIVARDADGPAPVGGEVSTMLEPINSADIAVDAVDANKIRAGEISASHISSNFFESGNIQTGAAGRRVVISSSGIQLIETDDSILIDLPTDDDRIASFYGDMQTSSLLSLDNLEVRGAQNELTAGSVVNLSAGVYAAAAPPTAIVDFPTTATTLDNALFRTRSVDWGSTYDFICRRFLNVTEIRRITLIGGVEETWNSNTYAISGLAVANDTAAAEDRLHVIGEIWEDGAGTGIWTLEQYDYTSWPPTQTRSFLWPHDTGVQFFSPNAGRDFTDTDQFVTCEVLPNQSQFRFRRFSVNTAEAIVLVATVDATAPGVGGSQLVNLSDKNIRGCAYGHFGIGLGNFYMVALVDRVWFFNDSGAHSIPASFLTNGSQNACAYSSVESRFKGYNNDDTSITTYTDWNPASAFGSVQLWGGYTLVDSVGTTHETTLSTQKTFHMKKRGRVTLGTPAIPGDGGVDEPDSVKFYVGGPSATAPARTSMWDQATQPAVGVTSQTYETLRIATGGGAVNPPATNNFPTAAPALLQTADGGTTISGDGTAMIAKMRGGSATDNTSTGGAANPQTNSTTYLALTGTAGPDTVASVTIPYPPSGVVEIHIAADMRVASAGLAFTSFQVRDTDAAGVVRFGASDDRAIYTAALTQVRYGASFRLTGLPTSGTMFVQMMHRSSDVGSTQQFRRRHIIATPCF